MRFPFLILKDEVTTQVHHEVKFVEILTVKIYGTCILLMYFQQRFVPAVCGCELHLGSSYPGFFASTQSHAYAFLAVDVGGHVVAVSLYRQGEPLKCLAY